ncbi:MAG: primosomal protein N' [Christensenellaceae bacterium]|jgi:primosomal protein N' (replication factor Y)|nr:primosomal protein N' [Christensenellaceae bacterium]
MIAEVIVDILNSNVDKIFDYNCREVLEVGHRVLVPFGGRNTQGYIIKLKASSTLEKDKLKDIIKPLDETPVLTPKMIELCFFMKDRFFLRLADTIRLFLPPQIRSDLGHKTVNIVTLTDKCDISKIKSNAKAQLGIILHLKEAGSDSTANINNKFSSAALKKLSELGFVKITPQNVLRRPIKTLTVEHKDITLTPQQQECVDLINKAKNTAFLLHGVTGSGKTEVYISAIKNVLAKGKSAIFLVPEISLTPQMLSRFTNAFGDTVALLHSSLSAGERYDEFYRLKTGQAKIAIGARSCIFAPLDDVGLIVIDEEHDSSYFSENNPRYYTHEVARMLAHIHGCNLVLGSATPNVESFFKAQQHIYKLLTLPNRAGGAELPQIIITDMLSEIRNGNTGIFSTVFLKELENCIKNEKQAMIFINRRGYASFMMCKECGYVAKCTDCDVSLVYHKEEDMLKCHYCGKRFRALTGCPACKSEYIRQGAVGTQRVTEELGKIFKDVPILRLDNDTVTGKDSYGKILEQFNSLSPAILVGTQMIAKGHDFNNVTLVGIIDADLSLHFSDFRATERTFQLITQVSGRAGRSRHSGKVILQTYFPKHFVYRFAHNYDYMAFYKKDINLREVTKFPPFAKILRILISSENEQKAIDVTREINIKISALKSKYNSDFIYFQAMKSPRGRIKNKFRYQILMRFFLKSEKEIVTDIHKIVDDTKFRDVSLFVELNPQNLS